MFASAFHRQINSQNYCFFMIYTNFLPKNAAKNHRKRLKFPYRLKSRGILLIAMLRN